MAASFWRITKSMNLGEFNVDFCSLIKDYNMIDSMCDCTKPGYGPSNEYKVIFRYSRESDAATPVLSLQTSRDCGNKVYRMLQRCKNSEQVKRLVGEIIAHVKMNGVGFCQAFPGRFSGYFDGELSNKNLPKDCWAYVSDSPVLAAN